ncbi:MAG TPA: glycosyltransferase, partial [Salinimicrobium sp.]|nr:glycosyltransferase [Salinimicrobium sp.]
PYSYCNRLESWIKENVLNFDAIIVHGLWQYSSFGSFSFWQRLKSKGEKVPKIYLMPHGMLDPYFQSARGRKLKAIRNYIFWHLIENKVVNGADGVLFTCQEELLLARKTFWAYKPKAELNIGYGIMPPPAYQQEFQEEFIKTCPEVKGRSYWLFLSRIHPKKGVELLAEAYLELRRQFHEIPDLIIAGPGLNSSYGKKLQKLSKNAPIYFTGMLEGSAKWGAFYGCKAFILPTHQENFGIAVVEALACGKPVLTTNKVNIWREIFNGNGGIISEDTAEGIYSMLNTWKSLREDKQRQMGINARNIYRSNFTVEKAAEKMLTSIS